MPLASMRVTPPDWAEIALSSTHLLPRWSMAIANGIVSVGPVNTLAAAGLPCGYSVTELPT